ncbi:MAG: bifunctional ADP-dependent NAD(P)H-hydrate dehydratase/NAD(P)H-hydrate epimerase [Microscillaceae bacterium]
MKIYTTAQVRSWDQFTIAHTPIASIDLMEQAAQAFVKALEAEKELAGRTCVLICGPGNNGGDGLAIARLLLDKGHSVAVYVVNLGAKPSLDFRINYQRLKNRLAIFEIRSTEDFPILPPESILIDALLGAGLSRPVEGPLARIVQQMNRGPAFRVAVDIPSGLLADEATTKGEIFKADLSITFEVPKLAFLMPENETFVGQWRVVPIGLHPDFALQNPTTYYFSNAKVVKSLPRPRANFAHKGTFGHALLIAGSYGKMGAALLCSHAALASGAGLVTAHIPRSGYNILQTALPEVMVETNPGKTCLQGPFTGNLRDYAAIGVGCGLGQSPETHLFLQSLLTQCQSPIVVDADAINLLKTDDLDLCALLPPGSILTPHIREFARLSRPAAHSWERLEILQNFAQVYEVYVILKGRYSALATPEGEVFFNETGNSGMATAGSGDVLTGLLTGLLAQGYSPREAALLGMYLHGKAGDLALAAPPPFQKSEETLLARDLIAHFGAAFQFLKQ